MVTKFEAWATPENAQSNAKKRDESDIHPWEIKEVPTGLAELPACFNIRAEDFGWGMGISHVVESALHGSDNEKAEAKLQLENGLYYMLNLMRLDSGLGTSTLDPEHWPESDLVAPNWGNDITPSRAERSITPRPGHFYRMVLANWPAVAKRLKFWMPENRMDISEGAVKRLEVCEKRKRALTFISTVRASLLSKHKGEMKEAKDELDQMDFESMNLVQLEMVDRAKLNRVQKRAHTMAIKANDKVADVEPNLIAPVE